LAGGVYGASSIAAAAAAAAVAAADAPARLVCVLVL
jgi:hypothetical protein